MESSTLWIALPAFLVLFYKATADRDILLTSVSSDFPISSYSKYDVDGNGIQMTVTDNSGEVFIRSNTMPNPSDGNAADVKENNAVAFPYISNPENNTMIHISLKYSHEQVCPTYIVDDVQCSNELELRVYSAEANTDPQSLLSDSVTPLYTYTLQSPTSAVSSPQQFDEYPEFRKDTVAGIRLVLVDKGSQFTVSLFTVSAYRCTGSILTGQLPIFCDDAWARSQILPSECSCGPNSEGKDQFRVLRNCQLHADIPDAAFTDPLVPCVCKAGYMEVVSTGQYDRECVEAPDTTPSSSTITSTSGEDDTGSNPTVPVGPDGTTPKDDNGSAQVLSGVSVSVWLAVSLVLVLLRY